MTSYDDYDNNYNNAGGMMAKTGIPIDQSQNKARRKKNLKKPKQNQVGVDIPLDKDPQDMQYEVMNSKMEMFENEKKQISNNQDRNQDPFKNTNRDSITELPPINRG